MALPPIIIADRDHVRVVSPLDPAIDKDATGEKALAEYGAGSRPDASTLVFDGEPTWFTVKGLTQHEMMAFRAIAPVMPERHEFGWQESAVEMAAQMVRFGLVAVEGLPGWERAKRNRLPHLPSHVVWDVDPLLTLGAGTLMFLFNTVTSLTNVPGKASAGSVSSRGSRNGTGDPKTQKQSDAPGHASSTGATTPSAEVG